MEFLAIIFILVGFVLAVLALYLVTVGDADFVFHLQKRTALQVKEQTENCVVFTCTIPFTNAGKQAGTIMDCFPRLLVPREYFDACKIEAVADLASAPRGDGYWEAVIIFKKASDAVLLTLTFSSAERNIDQALEQLPDITLSLVCQIVARSDWFLGKNRVILPADEFRVALINARQQEGL